MQPECARCEAYPSRRARPTLKVALPPPQMQLLCRYYATHGFGLVSQHSVLVWNGKLQAQDVLKGRWAGEQLAWLLHVSIDVGASGCRQEGI